eukprot:6799834-Pyramimonas_sp.AAC.1
MEPPGDSRSAPQTLLTLKCPEEAAAPRRLLLDGWRRSRRLFRLLRRRRLVVGLRGEPLAQRSPPNPMSFTDDLGVEILE